MSATGPAEVCVRRLVALGSVLVALLAAPLGASANDDYVARWGPAVGSRLPVLEAYDQAGELRTLENLAGEHGLLLVLSRSADW